ncbi:MAG: tetratricopeptide repeat protein [Gemmatimonadaceae bacterium]
MDSLDGLMANTRIVTAASVATAVLAIALVVSQQKRSVASGSTVQSAPLVAMPTTPFNEAAVRDRDIEFYSRRAQQDPASALDRTALASLLFTRSRYTGSMTDLARADTIARESIALRTQRNFQAFELLASILMARHEFTAARALAQEADSLDPGVPSHAVLLGEIDLELGDYTSAAKHFEKVDYSGQRFTIAARLARWHEVTGHNDIARKLLQQSIVKVDRRDDLPREQIAWFHYRLGELELRTGNTAAADAAFKEGLKRNPDDIRVLGGLARSALAQQDWQGAIAYGERAIAIQVDPTTLGTISRAYSAVGDTAQAASYAKAMSVSALTQPGVIHRAWGLFLLDHGNAKERATVLGRARIELRERKDVYGHDLLAWALYRNGDLVEARKEMASALAQHTQDVMLAEHARAMGIAPASAN